MKNFNYPDQRQAHAKLGAPGPTDRLCPQGCDLTTPQWHNDMWSMEQKHLKSSILHTSSLTVHPT